jgi:hypothetical protein
MCDDLVLVPAVGCTVSEVVSRAELTVPIQKQVSISIEQEKDMQARYKGSVIQPTA